MFSAVPTISFAQTPAATPTPTAASAKDYTSLAPLPCIAGNGVSCPQGNGVVVPTVNFKTYIQYAFNLLIALAAVAAVFQIVRGGITYMVSESINLKKDGLKIAQDALWGLLLVLCSYLILRTVDPRLVNISTTLVPQIELKKELLDPVTLSILSDLHAKSVEFQTNMAAVRNDVQKDEDKIKDITQQKTPLQNQVMAALNKIGVQMTDPSHTDEACKDVAKGIASTNDKDADAACLALVKMNDQISQIRIGQAYKVVTGEIEAIVYPCSIIATPDYVADCNKRIDAKAAQYKGELLPDQQQQLAKYVTYSHAVVGVNEQLSLVNAKVDHDGSGRWAVYDADQATKKIDTIVADYSKTNPDPASLAKIKDIQTKAKATIATLLKK